MISAVRCASCGADVTWDGDESLDYGEEGALARACGKHLLACPRRFYGHPAFGGEARWDRLSLAAAGANVVIELAWTTAAWGMPFKLWEVPGFEPGVGKGAPARIV